MRFAYIDSQGNEVPIPSIDALALRIELGAVGPDTQLYDAHADHWGPAHTHEIFHSLSRDAEEEGFMAPPPPVAQGPADDGEAEASVAPAEPEEPEEPESAEEPGGGAVDLGLTLADPPPEPPEAEEEEEAADGGLSLDLAEPSPSELSLAAEPEEPAEELDAPLAMEAESSAPASDGDGGGFDFGDLGTELEVEEAHEPEGMALETEMEFQGPGSDFGGGGGDDLQLEQPMSAFEPDSPPGWMDEAGPDDVMDFSAVAAEEDVEQTVAPVSDAPARQRRTPKDRPSPPKFKKERSTSGPVVLVVIALAIGVGGYYAWSIVQARMSASAASETSASVMPGFPDELLPQMRSLAETAIAGAVEDVAAATTAGSAPADPDEQWLAGAYLGNASQYPEIPAFWESMQDFADGLRERDAQLYGDSYAAAVAEAGLEADVAAQITERADAGFRAAQSQRLEVYGELDRLAAAAIELHGFLLESEADIIVYRPGLSIDAALEVDAVLGIAAPEARLSRTLELLDEVTEALDGLGSLDRVTRDRLVGAMTSRLQQVGIQ